MRDGQRCGAAAYSGREFDESPCTNRAGDVRVVPAAEGMPGSAGGDGEGRPVAGGDVDQAAVVPPGESQG
eukprot:9564682-Alexandrium_andersonii.AAC.1